MVHELPEGKGIPVCAFFGEALMKDGITRTINGDLPPDLRVSVTLREKSFDRGISPAAAACRPHPTNPWPKTERSCKLSKRWPKNL